MPRKTKVKPRSKNETKTPDIDKQLVEWQSCLSNLDPEERETVEHETVAAQAACGSRLGVAKHLSTVHDILCGDLENPKQKKPWTNYLHVTLPGLWVSRSQVFKDIKSWRKAEEMFPPVFLDAFIASGYSVTVRPTDESPLGKFTKPCEQLLSKSRSSDMNLKQASFLLAEAADSIAKRVKEERAACKEELASRKNRSADERRSELLLKIHSEMIDGLKALATAVEVGESYTTAVNVRDDVELVIGRIMTAIGVDEMELEPRTLPEDYPVFIIPGLVPEPHPQSQCVTDSKSVEAATG